MMRIVRPMSGLALPLIRRKVANIHAPVQNIKLSRWTPGRMRLAQPEKMSAELAGRQLSFHPVSLPVIGRKLQPAWQAMDLVLPNGAPPPASNKITSEQQTSASELFKKLTSQKGAPKPLDPAQAAAFNNPFGPLPPEKPAPPSPSTVWKKPEPGSRIFRKIEEIHAQAEKALDQPPAMPSAPATEPAPAPSRPAMMRKVEEVPAEPEPAGEALPSAPVREPPASPPAVTPAPPVQRTAAAPASSTPSADAGVPPAVPAPVIRRAWKMELPAKNPYEDEPVSAFPASYSQPDAEPEPWQPESAVAESSAPIPPPSLPEAPQIPSEAVSEIPSGDLPEIGLPEPGPAAASAPFSPPEATLRHPSRPQPQTAGEPAAEPGVGPSLSAAPAAQISRSPAPDAPAPEAMPPVPAASPEPVVQRDVEPTGPEAVEVEIPLAVGVPSPASAQPSFPPPTEQAPSVQGQTAAAELPSSSAASQPPAKLDLPVTHRPGVQRRAARSSEPAPRPEVQPGAQPTVPLVENRPSSASPAVTPPAPPVTPSGTPSLQREISPTPGPAVSNLPEAASPSAPAAPAPSTGPTTTSPSIQRASEAGAPIITPKREPPSTPPAAPAVGGGDAVLSSAFPSAPEPLQRQSDEVVAPPPDALPGSEPFDAPASAAPAGPQPPAPLERAVEQPAREVPASPAPAVQRLEAPEPPAPLQASPTLSSIPEIPSVEPANEPDAPADRSALRMDLSPRRHPGLDREPSHPVGSAAPSPASPRGTPPVQRAAALPSASPTATPAVPGPAAPEPAAQRPPEVEPPSLPSVHVDLAGPAAFSAAPEPEAPSLPPTVPAGDLPILGTETLQARLDLPLKSPIQRTPEAPAAEIPQVEPPAAPMPAAPAAKSGGESGGEIPPAGSPPVMPVVQRMSEYSRVYRSLAASLKREAPASSPAAGSQPTFSAGWPSGQRSPQGEPTAGFVLRRFRPLAATGSAAAASQPFFTAPSASQIRRVTAPSPLPAQPGPSAGGSVAGTLPTGQSGGALAAEQGGAPAVTLTTPAQGMPAPAASAWPLPETRTAPGEIRPLLRPGTLISRVNAPWESAPALDRGPSSLPGTLLASPSAAASISVNPLSPAGNSLAQRTASLGAASPAAYGPSTTSPWSMPAGTAAVGPASRPGSATRPVEMIFRRSPPAASPLPDAIRRKPGDGAPASNYYRPDDADQSSPPQASGSGDAQQPGGASASNYYSGHSDSPAAPPAPDSPPGQGSGAASSSNYYVNQDASRPPAAQAPNEINPEWAFSDTLMKFEAPPPVKPGPIIRPATPEELAETETSAAEPETPDVNLRDLARQVYPFIKRMLALERERTFSRKG